MDGGCIARACGLRHWAISAQAGVAPVNVAMTPQVTQVDAFARKNCLRFSICACHPRAGAMLIFSVSFQVQRMIPQWMCLLGTADQLAEGILV